MRIENIEGNISNKLGVHKNKYGQELNVNLNNEIKKVFGKNIKSNITLYSDKIHISAYKDLSNISSRNYKYPKIKKITKKWILNKVDRLINKKNSYKNLRSLFKNIKFEDVNLYYTSYGIGVFRIRFLQNKNKEINKIKKKLDNKGIEYKTEISRGGWVYRFRISKSKDNLNKIEDLK